METCVLIPQEFALAVTGLGARNSRDQTATVWSNTTIPQGTLCYPFQGTVRIDNLDVYSYVDEDDVSSILDYFGSVRFAIRFGLWTKVMLHLREQRANFAEENSPRCERKFTATGAV